MKVSDSQHRLVEMMEILGITQADIVKRTGVQKSSLSNYISGRRTPRQDQLSVIADPYGIDPAWLMGYDVDMYLQGSIRNQIMDAYSFANTLSQFNREQIAEALELYEEFKHLSPEDQIAIRTLVKSREINS